MEDHSSHSRDGRLNEVLPQFSASDDDGGHNSDPLFYMNASMMVAAALGQEFPIPEGTLPIRRGDWTHAELSTAIELGHDLVKELAYLSETSAYVPDSNLTIETNALPDFSPNASYGYQLVASGGLGGYLWELLPSTTLPSGLNLSVNGLLHGIITETGTWDIAFKVSDNMGSFRKVGLKLSSGTAEAVDFAVLLSSYDPTNISLPDDGSGTMTYAFTAPGNGNLSGTAPDLIYTPDAGIGSDSFTYTITSAGVTSDAKTVSIQIISNAQLAFNTWLANHSLSGDDASYEADTLDHDGYSVLLEFALGMDPTLSDAGSKESAYIEEEETTYFVYQYERRTDYLDIGLNYTLIPTPDLLTQSLSPPYDINVGEAVGGYQTITTRYPIDDEAKFIQLKIDSE